MMLVLWHQQRHKHVDIEKGNHGWRLFGTIHETVDIFNLEEWGARSWRKDRHATHKTYIRVGHPPEQGLRELVNLLAGSSRQISEPCFDLRVYGNGSRWHPGPSKPFLFILA
jgi:hypothetical protein